MRSILLPPYKVMVRTLGLICTLVCANLAAEEIQVGRYSLLVATPTQAQAELLATTVIIQYPARIQTVGEAVRYLLQRSGYRMVSTELIGADAQVLFALPLPVVHRSLGPMTLRAALETLAGPLFQLVQDPFHRLISFERCIRDRLDNQQVETLIGEEAVQHED
ncbi:MAG: hypothetical protein KZQ87_12755 [Candidatus Thiodiazotropha sp. (ex Cardiolucina cf. quadrata)]|nr:hypothetical protein [Candidatus Thiodiazotropha sp. (ex Cardiolucina cf. quadrata)]